MNTVPTQPLPAADWPLPSGADCLGGYRPLGISRIDFKLAGQAETDTLILENIFHAPGGPPRHLHHDQDEWFYALEGEFIIDIGGERRKLGPGDSVLAPRRVPHVWAYTGETVGRMLIMFLPAGQMAAFFDVVTQANAMPPQDPGLWQNYGMELLGPPLAID